MDQEFIDLMNLLLLGTKTPSLERTVLNPDYAGDINDNVETLNANLGIRPCEDIAFIGESPCFKKLIPNYSVCNSIDTSFYPVIGPVPFASCSDKPVFATFGLNPKFGKDTCEEKMIAGNDLKRYSAFYNSKSLTDEGVFPFVLSRSKYYDNLFQLYRGIISGKYKTLKEIFPENNKTQINFENRRLLKDSPWIIAELIPFHSVKTSVSINKLYKKNSNYKDYHTKLFKILNDKLDDQGIVLSHGKASSDVTLDQLKEKLSYIESDNHSYTLAMWEKRLVIILNDFLGRAGKGQKFRTHEQYQKLVETILDYCQRKKYSIPKYLDCIDKKSFEDNPIAKNLTVELSSNKKNLENLIRQRNLNNIAEADSIGTKTIEFFQVDVNMVFKEGVFVRIHPKYSRDDQTIFTGKIKRIFSHNIDHLPKKKGDEEATIEVIPSNQRPKKKYHVDFKEIESLTKDELDALGLK